MNSDVKLVYFTASSCGTDTCLCGTNVDVSEEKNEKVADFCNSGERYAVAYPGILFAGGSTNSVEDRENGDLEAAVIWYKKFPFI